MKTSSWQVVILAAGKSSRMNSKKHKSLITIAGKNLLTWCYELATTISNNPVIITLSYNSEEIISKNKQLKAAWFVQNKLGGGTATSLYTTINSTKINACNLLVLYVDDAFLYSQKNITNLCLEHENNKNILTLLTFKSPPLPIGGVIRDVRDIPFDTIDYNQATKENVKQLDILCGAIAINKQWFKNNYSKIITNYKGEKGLPELINIAYTQNRPVSTYPLSEGSYWQGVNTKQELLRARYLKYKQIKHTNDRGI